jgi:cullin 1
MSRGGKAVTLEAIWPPLEAGVGELISNLNRGFPIKRWMGLYTDVYNYCTTARPSSGAGTGTGFGGRSPGGAGGMHLGANFVGEELYMKLRGFLTEKCAALRAEAETRHDENLLLFFYTEWTRYTTAMRYVSHIFQYLNRHWIRREAEDGRKDVYEIFPLSLVVWRETFFSAVKGRLTAVLLQLIEKERSGEQIDTSLVQGVIDAYVRLGLNRDRPNDTTLDVYRECFEDEFLLATEVFYTAEATSFIAMNTVADYMKKVEFRLDEEVVRVRQYLHPLTEAALVEKCESALIDKHKHVIQAEFSALVEHDKAGDLARMYSLLKRIDGLDPLRQHMEAHVQRFGAKTISEVAPKAINDPKLYVDTVLGVYRKFNAMVSGDCFENDAGFVAALDKACRRFINDNAVCARAQSASKSPELLARFVDLLLKKSARVQIAANESDVDLLLCDVMTVFKFIEDKDVFQTFYSKMLAKRLIHGTSANEDWEGSMIAKLRQSCGFEYTSKLQRMFQDMGVSRDLNDEFRKWCEKGDRRSDVKTLLGVDFSMLVLATGSWPLQPPSTNFSIPAALESCEQTFFEFYSKKHNGRKLNWLHQLSKGEVKTNYLKSNRAGYTFQVSTYQLGVLVLFNDDNSSDGLTANDIQISTQLTDSALRGTLLALVKAKVLLMKPKPSATISPDSLFVLNTGFRSKRTKVNINIPVPQQVREDTDATHKAIEEDRKLAIQAAIVRIMKTRKQLPHSQLMSEVVGQLKARFQPKIVLIKKCIDMLIEKEYLERVDGQKDVYSYLA